MNILNTKQLIKDTVASLIAQVKASKVIQDLTHTAQAYGAAGNNITVAYTDGGTAGAEVVTVTGLAISVQIQSGVSTATQISTALTASAPALALITTTVSGTGSNAQTAVAATNLTGGVTAVSQAQTLSQEVPTESGISCLFCLSGLTGLAGTVSWQGSNDAIAPTNWVEEANTVLTTTTAATKVLKYNSTGGFFYRWFQAVWTPTGGTGTVAAVVFYAKEF